MNFDIFKNSRNFLFGLAPTGEKCYEYTEAATGTVL